MATAPPLLLCSVSEALARSSGETGTSGFNWPGQKLHSPSVESTKAVSFKESKCTGAVWKLAHPPSRTCCQPSASAVPLSSFTVQPRRQAQLPRRVQFFLSLETEQAALDARRFATALHSQVVARFTFLIAAHDAIQSQLEHHVRPIARLQGFLRFLRHPERLGERRAGVDGTGFGTQNMRIYRGPRQAQRIAENAMAKERSLALEEAADLFEQAATACESAGDMGAAAEYWSRASKQWSDMTYVPGTSDSRAAVVNQKAIELGLKSVQADANTVGLSGDRAACAVVDCSHAACWHVCLCLGGEHLCCRAYCDSNKRHGRICMSKRMRRAGFHQHGTVSTVYVHIRASACMRACSSPFTSSLSPPCNLCVHA